MYLPLLHHPYHRVVQSPIVLGCYNALLRLLVSASRHVFHMRKDLSHPSRVFMMSLHAFIPLRNAPPRTLFEKQTHPELTIG